MKTANKIILLVLIILSGIGLILAIFIYPALKEMKSITKETYLMRKDLEIKYQKGQRVKQTILDLKKIEPAISQLSSAYLKKGDELALITTLEQLAQQNNLEQKIDLTFKDQAIKNKTISVPVHIILTGDFISILKYLSALEQFNYYLNLTDFIFRQTDNLKVQPTDGSARPTPGLNQVSINGNITWQPQTISP